MNEELEYFENELLKIRPDKNKKDIHRDAMSIAKHRWVKYGEEWVLRNNTISSGLSKEAFFQLMIKRPELPDKPDFTEQQNRAVANIKKYPHNFSLVGSLEIVEEVSNPAFFEYFNEGTKKDSSKIKNQKPNDYVLMKSVLCTSLPFVNANGDAFRDTDLVGAVESGQLDKLQPAIVDWGHDFQMYGSTVGAEVVETEIEISGLGKNKVKQIHVYSVFHAWLNPQKAGKIRKWASKGILAFSMACGAEKATYLNGGSVRVLEKPHFVANSIIPPDGDPADDSARLLEIAGKKNEEIPIIYSTYSEVPKNLVCAWYKPGDNKQPENNTGEDMDLAKKIEELEATILSLTEENGNLKKSEAAKKIITLEVELEALKAEKDALDTSLEEAKTSLTIAEKEKQDTVDALGVANGKLKELRSGEVERINEARKAEIQKIVGDDEGKVSFWFEKYKASVSEDGEIVDPEDEFKQAMEAMPAKEGSVDDETSTDDNTTANDNTDDVASSDKVDRSKNNPPIATASSDDDKKLFKNSIA